MNTSNLALLAKMSMVIAHIRANYNRSYFVLSPFLQKELPKKYERIPYNKKSKYWPDCPYTTNKY
jgi:hypothetical protein